jgi:protein SCO1/2
MGAMSEQIERGADRTPRPPWGVVWVVLVALVGVAVAFVLFRPHTYAGSVLQAPVPAESLDGLVFSDGRPADLAAFSGDVVLVYFGYTNCPDICPTTLARAAEAKRLMGSSGDDLQVLMVSVDPERDTQEALAQYMAFFDDSFLGVTGPVEALDRVATLYGIYVKRNEGTAESGYTVDHTGTLMAIDPDGYLRVIYPNDVSADALASDLRALLET